MRADNALPLQVERILTGELMAYLQKQVLLWPQATTDTVTACNAGVLSASASDAVNYALRDIEKEMVAVRMSAQAASLSSVLKQEKGDADTRCSVSVHALALGDYARILSANSKVRRLRRVCLRLVCAYTGAGAVLTEHAACRPTARCGV